MIIFLFFSFWPSCLPVGLRSKFHFISLTCILSSLIYSSIFCYNSNRFILQITIHFFIGSVFTMLTKLLFLSCALAYASSLVIEKADRQFDLTGHLAKLEEKLIFLGSDKSSSEFEYFLPKDLGDKAVYFEASVRYPSI